MSESSETVPAIRRVLYQIGYMRLLCFLHTPARRQGRGKLEAETREHYFNNTWLTARTRVLVIKWRVFNVLFYYQISAVTSGFHIQIFHKIFIFVQISVAYNLPE